MTEALLRDLSRAFLAGLTASMRAGLPGLGLFVMRRFRDAAYLRFPRRRSFAPACADGPSVRRAHAELNLIGYGTFIYPPARCLFGSRRFAYRMVCLCEFPHYYAKNPSQSWQGFLSWELSSVP